MSVKKNSLGRGLSALIDNSPLSYTNDINTDQTQRTPATKSAMDEIEISKISINPFQPRKHFDEVALSELTDSIKQLGVIQPITVREIEGDQYQIITGERRFRASKIAGLLTIPAYIRKVDDNDMLAIALVENIQRADLNAIEIAISYQRLIEECSLTQENLSEKVGKKRATVTNYLRLLKLPAEIQYGIKENKISMGHARSIISIDDSKKQLLIYQKIIDQELSVRAVEELVRKLETPKEPKADKSAEVNNDYDDLRQQIANQFKVNVSFQRNPEGNGKIVIPFRSDDELERIISVFDKIKDNPTN